MRVLAVVIVLGALAAAGAFLVAARALDPVSVEGSPTVLVIPSGATVREIAEMLEEAGLIRSRLAFIALARVRGVTNRLQSGEYAFSPALSAHAILDRLARGAVVLHAVTIPEGYTAAQITETLSRRGLVDRAAFLGVARRGGLTFGLPFLTRPELEGYLFPDTYQFPRGLVPERIIRQMLERFDERVTEDLRAALPDLGITLHEAITIASMVEREARVPRERPIIAGVIYNRLRRGWRLEIDATVLYALGRHKERLTLADLQVDSPYNTYRHAGLPPGPIANPGREAIEAALHPADTPYLFYVLRPDGAHAFSRTLAEHQRAIRRWRP